MFADPTAIALSSAFAGTSNSFVKLSESAQTGSVFAVSPYTMKIRHILPTSNANGNAVRRHQLQISESSSIEVGGTAVVRTALVRVNVTIEVPQWLVDTGTTTPVNAALIAGSFISNTTPLAKLLRGEN